MVYVYRENMKLWISPLKLIHTQGKHALVLLNGTPREFNIAQLKPAPILDPATDPITDAQQVYITEVLSPNDPRKSLFGPAISKEMNGLIDRGTFQLCLRSETDPIASVLSSRFLLSIKRADDGEEIYKARLVVGGHMDKSKNSLIHKSNSTAQTSIRMLLATALIFGFRLWSMDVTQAYLQSAKPLLRDVYLKPDVLQLSQDELIRRLKPLYGLGDSGDYWHTTITGFHLSLRFSHSAGDFALYFRRIEYRLIGLSSTFVDDLLQAGTEEFRGDVVRELQKSFEIKGPVESPLMFAGVEVKEYLLSQYSYIRSLKSLPENAPYKDFRSVRARLAWVVQTRPDICCVVAMASQVTESMFDGISIKLIQ
jgi:hypothetical protein